MLSTLVSTLRPKLVPRPALETPDSPAPDPLDVELTDVELTDEDLDQVAGGLERVWSGALRPAWDDLS